MNWLKKLFLPSDSQALTTSLYDEDTFYRQFVRDLLNTKEEVIIESPYITQKRLDLLKPTFEYIVRKGIRIIIVTRAPQEHDRIMASQSERGIRYFEFLGQQVLIIRGRHHRKLAMIDRKILWEGSLNILSQSYSREFMRRIDSRPLTQELFHFLKLDKLHVEKSTQRICML